MTRTGQLAVLAVGAAAALGLVAACGRGGDAAAHKVEPAVGSRAAAIPRLVDLGAGKCIPCKAMAPILEQLRSDYAGRIEVTFIDVWKTPDQAAPYGIRVIPTQIFYAADGRELARHEGFISREQILAQWKAVGLEL
jgi:thioredoxin 1